MKAKNRGVHAAAAAPISPNSSCNETIGGVQTAKKKQLAGTEPAAAANSRHDSRQGPFSKF